MICKYGRPSIWFTICPAQHSNPLVLKLGNIPESLYSQIKDRVKFAAEDPVSCTEFFHLTIRNVLAILKSETGMDEFYAVVEAQMRGTLHLHLLGWITNHNMKTEEDWIKFADQVSCSVVNLDSSFTEEDINQLLCKFPEEVKSEAEIIQNSMVLCQSTLTNLHDSRHRKSCYKTSNGGKSGSCRYKFPREIRHSTRVTKEGIELARNHAYINTYNPSIMHLFRCNMDIRILPDLPSDDLLALMFYLTNYTTKMEHSNYSVCDVAATARQELLQELSNPAARQYADRLFIRILNKITGKNEISSNLVVNELLGYPEEYCSQKFKTLNYGIFLRSLRGEEFDVHFRIPRKAIESVAEEDLDEECITETIAITTLYDDYVHRGSSLEYLSLYQYVSRVYKKKIDPLRGISKLAQRFSEDHPQSLTHVQVLVEEKSAKIPKLVGPATTKFSEREYVELMMILFKPWTKLKEIQDSDIHTIEGFMDAVQMDSDENIALMENFMLLQKSKLAAERKRKEKNQDSNPTEEDGELLKGGNNYVDESDEKNDDELNDEDELEDLLDIIDIPPSKSSDKIYLNMVRNLCMYIIYLIGFFSLMLLVIDSFTSKIAPSLYVSDQVSQSSIVEEENKTFEECEAKIIQLQQEKSEQLAFITNEDDIESVVKEVSNVYNLNKEQIMALTLGAQTLFEQKFMILCGEAGTGKSKCLEAMNAFFRIMGQGSNIVSSGTTGVSSARLKCKTIHSLCGWRPYKSSETEYDNPSGISALKKHLPNDLKLLLIDEFSMLDAKMIGKIDGVLRRVFRKPDVLFGGISVCFSGDFFQLPPVGGHSLMKDIASSKKKDKITSDVLNGLLFWRSIENVVILQQNYRQQDERYLSILRNWKNGKMKESDWSLLRSRQVNCFQRIKKMQEKDLYLIVKYNETRNALNKSIVTIGSRNRHIYECRAKDSCSTASIEGIEDYLKELNDNRSNYFPGLIRFFIGAQIVLTHNYDPPSGAAKGTRGVIIDYDQEKDQIKISSPMIKRSTEDSMDGNMRSNEFIVKRITTTFNINGHVIRRSQFGLDLGYSVTDYKSQGETVSSAFIDISEGTYFSIYVMLSRVRSLDGLFLLNDFNPDKIKPVVPESLRLEMDRLESLFNSTKLCFGL